MARLPHTWGGGSWGVQEQQIRYTTDCGSDLGCPTLRIAVFELSGADRDAQAYAADLRTSISLQPQYRAATIEPAGIAGADGALVTYTADRMVKGQVETTQHSEYIFVGKLWRYHMDFSSPAVDFEANRPLFKALASEFVYLR